MLTILTPTQLGLQLGTIVNHAYQCGEDEGACRNIAREIRDSLPEDQRAAFTDAVEMCGLWLSE